MNRTRALMDVISCRKEASSWRSAGTQQFKLERHVHALSDEKSAIFFWAMRSQASDICEHIKHLLRTAGRSAAACHVHNA